MITTLNRTRGAEMRDLVVSNDAFSELPAPVQKIYIEKVIRQAPRGYMTMNSGRDLRTRRSAGKMTMREVLDVIPGGEVFEAYPTQSE